MADCRPAYDALGSGSGAVKVGPSSELTARNLLQYRGPPVRGEGSVMPRNHLLSFSSADQNRPLIVRTHKDVRRLDVAVEEPRSVDVR